MQVKTISYKRVLNLGNYENKHLELLAEVHEGDNLDAEISHLMETVERKIREHEEQKIEAELENLRQHRSDLRKQIRDLKQELGQLQQGAIANPADLEPSIDDIPFEAGDTAQSSGIPDGF
ncbi:hypothetical protein NIES2107_60960 [Nostoc carneum NIES-2107]|nr:hypothetical protein NIES2107_60960 [Nostoc carneum NIES-2107]